MGQRLLVMGDNHGDTEALQRVLDDTAGESFDYVVHVGDFTRAMRHARDRGAEQLRDVEPVLREFEDLADHGLVWVWGNQDYFGDLDYDLDVGTEIPGDSCVTVGGQRFTNSLAHVDPNTVLVTHMEHWRLADHFDGKAHFCGNTHFGRRLDHRLNSAFLQATDPDTGEQRFGGYFVVEFADGPETDDSPNPDDGRGFDVELRSIGDLERRVCDRHRERGVQFLPSDWDCMYSWDDRVLLREMAASAFYGVTRDAGRESATVQSVVEYAVDLWDDPPNDFRADFATYLASLDDDQYAPLTETGDGCLAVVDESYSY